jgi:ubiquinone/menaquinone biosynthesis C-methylase UbiE
MPTMSNLEQAFCRSTPWRVVTQRVVLPWALQGVRPRGDVLEVGGGGGAMAAALLAAFDDLRLTVTDVDPSMVSAARRRLAPHGDRVRVEEADATGLPFADGTFDGVLSFIMLHHVLAWERALAEAVRVLRPEGILIAYDLLDSPPNRLVHRIDGHRNRLMRRDELEQVLHGLPLRERNLRVPRGGMLVRFHVVKEP